MGGIDMDQHSGRHSHLFTVRLWLAEGGDGRLEWRGRAQHVASGETRYFRDWAALVQFLEGTLPPLLPPIGSESDGERFTDGQ